MKHFSEDDLKVHKRKKRRNKYPAIISVVVIAVAIYAEISYGFFGLFNPTKEVYLGQVAIMCPTSWEQEQRQGVFYISSAPLNEKGSSSVGVYEMKSLKGIMKEDDLKYFYEQSLDILFQKNGYKPQDEIYIQNNGNYIKVVRKYHVLSDAGQLRVVYGNILVSQQSAYAAVVSGVAEDANRVIVPLEDSISLDTSKPIAIKFSPDLPVRSA